MNTVRCCALMVFGLLLAATAHAADDRFDGTAYAGKGGFLPVHDEGYARECGACHFVYSPGLLPAASWERLLDGLDSHFGENLSLQASEVAPIKAYLVENAADRSDYRGSLLIMETMPASEPPARIIDVPRIARGHMVLRWLRHSGGAALQARSFTNCNECHRRAGDGSWALDELAVPGLRTRVIKSGDLF